MTFFIILFIGLIVFLLVTLAPKLKKTSTQEKDWPFYSKAPLTNVEQVIYYRLIEALPDKIILGQVQLSRFISVKKGHSFNSWFNKINRMSIDYLVCDKDFSIIAAIELDDNSHNKLNRQGNDDKKNKVLASAGVRLIRWHVKNKPDVNQIQQDLLSSAKVL